MLTQLQLRLGQRPTPASRVYATFEVRTTAPVADSLQKYTVEIRRRDYNMSSHTGSKPTTKPPILDRLVLERLAVFLCLRQRLKDLTLQRHESDIYPNFERSQSMWQQDEYINARSTGRRYSRLQMPQTSSEHLGPHQAWMPH